MKMQNDLISRQAVIDIIHKEIERTTSYAEHDTQINIEQAVEELPTAYDVDKVVAEVDDFEIRCCDCQESCSKEGCLIERIKNVIINGGKE